MDEIRTEADARYTRRVVAITRLVKGSPNRWRDTVEVMLECGHRHQILRLNERNSPYPVERTRDLVGTDYLCGKCRVVERIRVKCASRRTRSSREGGIYRPTPLREVS